MPLLKEPPQWYVVTYRQEPGGFSISKPASIATRRGPPGGLLLGGWGAKKLIFYPILGGVPKTLKMPDFGGYPSPPKKGQKSSFLDPPLPYIKDIFSSKKAKKRIAGNGYKD